MGKGAPFIIWLAMILVACSPTARSSQAVETVPGAELPHPEFIIRGDGRTIYSFCRTWEFSGPNRAVEFSFPVSNEPIVLHELKGRITYTGWEGSWQEGVLPVVELRGPGDSAGTWEVRGNSVGDFIRKGLPQGQYCFFAGVSVIGWQGAFGILIIDKKADPSKELDIVLGFGNPRQ
jgi:hypothetical protein